MLFCLLFYNDVFAPHVDVPIKGIMIINLKLLYNNFQLFILKTTMKIEPKWAKKTRKLRKQNGVKQSRVRISAALSIFDWSEKKQHRKYFNNALQVVQPPKANHVQLPYRNSQCTTPFSSSNVAAKERLMSSQPINLPS